MGSTGPYPLNNGWRGSHYGMNQAVFHRNASCGAGCSTVCARFNCDVTAFQQGYSGNIRCISRPTEFYFVSDAGVSNGSSFGTGWSTSIGQFSYDTSFLPHNFYGLTPYWRHGNGTPMAFLDGHVEFLTADHYDTSPNSYGQHGQCMCRSDGSTGGSWD
jgi:prepilin-type processing-associated H-X9-DG protein